MKKKIVLLLAAAASLGPVLPASAVSIEIDVRDRPYAIHGPFYYVGRTHYVWVPGHWNRRHTRWIRGHYVVR